MDNYLNQLSREQRALLQLMRCSLWGEKTQLSGELDWKALAAMAWDQGVTSVAYDGARHSGAQIPEPLLKKWNEKMLQGVLNNARLMKAQDELLGWLDRAQIPAAVLKGSSNSRNYPQPDLRVLGDIDILVNRESLEQVQAILEEQGYQLHEVDPGYHISFQKGRICVEVHYDVTEFPNSPGGRLMAEYAAGFLEDRKTGVVGEHSFPMLSESNQALTLLLHMIRHMFGSCIGLRQLYDWAMFIANADRKEWETATMPILEKCGILRYAQVATRTCVCYLGLSPEGLEWCSDTGEELCLAFIRDVFRGGSLGEADKDGMGSLFTNSVEMGTAQAPWKALVDRLNQAAYRHVPCARQCKILLPALWVYVPVRYLTLAALGRRPQKSVRKVVASAKQRRELYDMLKLYEIE